MTGSNQCKHGHLARVCEVCELEQQLAASQAREAKLREALEKIDVHYMALPQYACDALTTPADDTALQESIKQAKRDALLEAADTLGFGKMAEFKLRRMAEELES